MIPRNTCKRDQEALANDDQEAPVNDDQEIPANDDQETLPNDNEKHQQTTILKKRLIQTKKNLNLCGCFV